MRIIGGEARGRRLFAPEGTDTRPTADKTRESLFSILMRDVPSANVLDLFGGTGALALEALSRGADFACISDISPKAVRIIERNAETVLGEEKGKKVRILKADYKSAVQAFSPAKFSLVFLDPPYRLKDAYFDSLDRLISMNMLTEDCVVVMERAKDIEISAPDSMEIYDERVYRDTVISFARFRNAES